MKAVGVILATLVVVCLIGWAASSSPLALDTSTPVLEPTPADFWTVGGGGASGSY